MRFLTLGDETKPVIVMLPGSLCPAESMAYLYEELKNDYYIIAADYNGHYEGTTFTTRQNEAKELADHLLENGITNVGMLYGQSMGAEVGIELLSQLLKRGVKVKSAIWDGAPCVRPLGAYRVLLYHVMKSLVAMIRKKGVDGMLDMGAVKKLANGDTESLRPMVEPIAAAVKCLTDESIKNEAECCTTFDFPHLPDEVQRNMHFFYAKEESAYKASAKNVKKAYPLAKFKIVSGYGHMTYSVKNKAEYISMLKDICG